MKRILSLVALTFIYLQVSSQELPSKGEIIGTLSLVNDFWIHTNPYPGNNQWARAAYFTGNLDFYNVYPKKNYLDYANSWAVSNNWALSGGVDTRNADNQCAGQAYIDLYNLDEQKEDQKIAGISESISGMVSSQKINDWWWIDALYMAMPVFTRLGVLYSDTSYTEKMYRLYEDTKNTRGLYNSDVGLWYRDESFKPPYLTPNGLHSFWSRGNGWVFAAHVRILQLLQETDNHLEEYIETFQTMALALKEIQRPDGFWNVSLKDPDDYGGPETSGTSFFTYGFAWGINNGLLDSAAYYPVVVKAWKGLTDSAVHENGYLGYVQGVGSNPSSSQPVTSETTADFGVGAFLLAGSEVVKLAAGDMPWLPLFFMDSLKVLNRNLLQVYFNDSIDETTGSDTSNYSLNGVAIQSITISGDKRSSLLSVEDIPPGNHALIINNIRSVSGQMVEAGETIQFVFNENFIITASGYEPGTSNVPGNTMDFNLGTRWSSEGFGEWIMYDLGEAMTIESVDIAFYNGNQRKAYFSISLSADGESFVEVFNGESGGESLDPENFYFDDQEARFVKITGYGNSTSMWNSITEVRIHASPSISLVKDIPILSQDLNIFPNPSYDGIVYLVYNFKPGRRYNISIHDIAGRKVYDTSIDIENTKVIALSDLFLPSGLYGISIVGTGTKITRLLCIK